MDNSDFYPRANRRIHNLIKGAARVDHDTFMAIMDPTYIQELTEFEQAQAYEPAIEAWLQNLGAKMVYDYEI